MAKLHIQGIFVGQKH